MLLFVRDYNFIHSACCRPITESYAVIVFVSYNVAKLEAAFFVKPYGTVVLRVVSLHGEKHRSGKFVF